MVISPNDFSLWARLTGNKYPSTPAERAKKGPEVHNFIQNLDKEGMLGGKEAEEPKKERNLGEKIATGALIAGGVAAAVAAGRDPRVQNVARRAGSTAKDKVGDFLRNIGGPRVIDRDVVDASYDVTPNPKEQQSNTAPTQSTDEVVGYAPQGNLFSDRDNRVMMGKAFDRSDQYQEGPAGPRIPTGVSSFQQNISKDNYTPLVQGETFFTEKGISKEDPYGDISNLEKRVDRTYGNVLNKLKPADAASTRASLIRGAARERDYALGYMNAMARGRTDEQATITGRKFAGYDLSPAVKPQTPFREALSELKIASTVPAKIDELLNLVETGPQIILPEKAQKINDGSSAIVLAGGGNNTNVIPTIGATIGGSSLTDKHATKMAVDNALDNVRAKLTGTPVPITGVRIEGPSNIQKAGPDTVIERNKAGDITGIGDANYRPGQRELPIIYSTDRETNQQMRRIEPTNQQLSDIKQEQGEVATDRFGNMMITSPTYDSITGFKPSTESISTNPLEERISRLEGKTAELRAIQENLSRAGELMSAGLDPRTTRFDSARAAGLTSKTDIEPRITNPRFQENMNLGKVQEAALPKPAARAYFEQDSEGRIIPATMEQRSGDRRVVKGPDTKTIESGGGYQPRGGVGSSIGAYGVEPSDFAQADITKKPTEISLPKTARDKRGMSDLSNQAVIKLTGSSSKGTARKAREELSVRDPGGTGSISDPTKVNPGETFDVAREVQRIQSDATIAPEKRRLSKEGLNELVERVRNRRALNLPTNLKESPFFYQNGD